MTTRTHERTVRSTLGHGSWTTATGTDTGDEGSLAIHPWCTATTWTIATAVSALTIAAIAHAHAAIGVAGITVDVGGIGGSASSTSQHTVRTTAEAANSGASIRGGSRGIVGGGVDAVRTHADAVLARALSTIDNSTLIAHATTSSTVTRRSTIPATMVHVLAVVTHATTVAGITLSITTKDTAATRSIALASWTGALRELLHATTTWVVADTGRTHTSTVTAHALASAANTGASSVFWRTHASHSRSTGVLLGDALRTADQSTVLITASATRAIARIH